jgi:hypothetical protein
VVGVVSAVAGSCPGECEPGRVNPVRAHALFNFATDRAYIARFSSLRRNPRGDLFHLTIEVPIFYSGMHTTFRVDMITFFGTLIRIFFHAFRSKRIILSENALLKKENHILLRRVGKKRVHFNIYDKLYFVVLNRADDIKHRLTLVKPETLLSWQRTLIKRFWTFEHAPAKRGRKRVDTDVKNLILSMKNDNLLWGVKRSRANC